MGRFLPINMITIIRLEDVLGHDLTGWPRRETDRDQLNGINASNGCTIEHTGHGRTFLGRGDDYVEEFRGKVIAGKTIADVMYQMQDIWLMELVKVDETKTGNKKTRTSAVPKTKLQFKYYHPTTIMDGEPDIDKSYELLEAIASQDLSVRGFWTNHYDDTDMVSLILGPAEQPGEPLKFKFSRGETYLYIDF